MEAVVRQYLLHAVIAPFFRLFCTSCAGITQIRFEGFPRKGGALSPAFLAPLANSFGILSYCNSRQWFFQVQLSYSILVYILCIIEDEMLHIYPIIKIETGSYSGFQHVNIVDR